MKEKKTKKKRGEKRREIEKTREQRRDAFVGKCLEKKFPRRISSKGFEKKKKPSDEFFV